MKIYILKDIKDQVKSFGHLFYYPINFVISVSDIFRRD